MNEKEIKTTRWKVHRAITPYGLGGSNVVLNGIMKILGDLENENDDSSSIGSLFGGLCPSDRQNGKGKEYL